MEKNGQNMDNRWTKVAMGQKIARKWTKKWDKKLQENGQKNAKKC